MSPMPSNPYQRFSDNLQELWAASNLRSIPKPERTDLIDFTSNDYMGIARRTDWQDEFLAGLDRNEMAMTSSASRLLAGQQDAYTALESQLESYYGRPALLFNSGYHANSGIIPAIADNKTMILADKLVHASIIDGIRLSGAKFSRFKHNDYQHLQKLIEKEGADFNTILVIVESVYSMDGDCASIDCLIDIKTHNPKVMLYVDEAHAFGTEGPGGLGLTAASKAPEMVDILIGTLGKAAASQGAFAIMHPIIKDYLINRSRSLIFSTAIPPISAKWSSFVIKRMVGMDSERKHLHLLAEAMSKGFSFTTSISKSSTAIQPFVIGNSSDTLALSSALREDGIKVLPIRTPTVPPNTERLRFSLSAAHTFDDVDKAVTSLKRHYEAIVHK